MASLADAQPPIALGALDGRYRAAVAPLVDHLSEAALNRERVRVEVEWLIHQTGHGVIPGVRKLSDVEVAALRGIVEWVEARSGDGAPARCRPRRQELRRRHGRSRSIAVIRASTPA